MNTHKKNKKLGNGGLPVKYTPEDARRIVEGIFRDDSDPQSIFCKIATDILPKLTGGNIKEREWAQQQILGRSSEAVMTMGLTNHYQIISTADRQYASLILEVTRGIEKDYACTTTTERALAETVAIAYMRVIDASRMFQEWHENRDRPDWDIATRHLEMMSRHIDRANRQFLTALAMLKQIRQPALEVNIRTKNTFVAKNQQINAGSKPHENN